MSRRRVLAEMVGANLTERGDQAIVRELVKAGEEVGKEIHKKAASERPDGIYQGEMFKMILSRLSKNTRLLDTLARLRVVFPPYEVYGSILFDRGEIMALISTIRDLVSKARGGKWVPYMDFGNVNAIDDALDKELLPLVRKVQKKKGIEVQLPSRGPYAKI